MVVSYTASLGTEKFLCGVEATSFGLSTGTQLTGLSVRFLVVEIDLLTYFLPLCHV